MQPQARDGNGQDKLRDQEAEQVRREGCSVKGGRVVGRQTGFEFTPQYEDGARKALEICRRNGITVNKRAPDLLLVVHLVSPDKTYDQVYILGCRNHFHILAKSIGEIGRVMGVSLDDVRFVDTLPCVNWSMRIGGFLSRFMGLRAIGRPLVIRGTRKAYQCLADLARETRAAVR